MNLADKKVVHETFGKGNVVNYNDSYIKINFESGNKKFIFPDAFRKYITFTDQRATDLVRKKIQQKEEKLKKEELILEREKALEQKRQDLLEEKENMKNRRIHPQIQSVFWPKEQEDQIFTEWRVFTGRIKTGKREGQPRQLVRMNQNSACLITKREPSMLEEGRQILGVFMPEETFSGRSCEDGYIIAHPEYRLRLSEQESEKMLFWNYYVDKRFPNKTTWNSGSHRYFDNIWMAQILRDIVSLKEKPQEQKEAQSFFEYFCRIHEIEEDELLKPNGALMRM